MISQIRHKIRIKRLKEVYYIRGSLTKRVNKRQKKIKRKAKENTAKTARNQTPTMNLKTALLQIKSYVINGKKRQAKNLFYIRNLTKRSQAAKIRKKILAVTS